MINYYLRKIKDKTLIEPQEYSKGCWINVIEPNKEELEELANNHNLDMEMLKDGLDNNELPRIDYDEKSHYIYIKTISKTGDLITLLLVIAQEFILTLSNEETKLAIELQKQKHVFFTTQKTKSLIYWLLTNNRILEQYIAYFTKIINQKRHMDDIKESDLNSLLMHEETLNKLTSAYTYMLHVYHKLAKTMDFFEEDKDLINDLIIDSEEAQNICLSSVKTISNIRNHHTLILQNKLNRNIKVLTIFTILVSISTAVSGIFGMNVALPFQESHYALLAILGLIIILTIIFIFFLRKNDLF